MQFKHPEILYALFVLIIPIVVHLFQLQRFTRTYFTNVKILKRIEQSTRKSARLKKWLVLCSRLLTFTCLVLAFSQPFFSEHSDQKELNTSLYLDNSFSMQSKGENGELLKSNAQKIITNNNIETNKISLLTNDKFSPDLDQKALKNELISTYFTPNHLDLTTAILKFNIKDNTGSNNLNRIVLISDFQYNTNINKLDFTNVNSPIWLVKSTPNNGHNIFIDSLYIAGTNSTETILNVIVKSTKILEENIPIAMHNKQELFGKSSAQFKNSDLASVEFTLPNRIDFNGLISVADNNLEFDNDFYFTLSAPEKINVLSIGDTSDYLNKIFTNDEFNFNSTTVQHLNYNSIQDQQLIVLNEIDEFPVELISNLSSFSKNQGSLLIIPSEKVNLNSYNSFFDSLAIGRITEKIEQAHKITSINFEHPIAKDIFEKKVTNFSYPTIDQYYKTSFIHSSTIVQLDNNHAYISSLKKGVSDIYWVASPLKNDIPTSIIVPLFYNFARNSLKINQLYYTLGSDKEIEIKTSLLKDRVLKISNETNSYIPLQKILQNKVILSLDNSISQSGFYTIESDNSRLGSIAFNYNRDESALNYTDIESIANNNKNVTIAASIASVFNELNQNQKINWVFKWFLAFSVLFLLIEMLLLKYFNI